MNQEFDRWRADQMMRVALGPYRQRSTRIAWMLRGWDRELASYVIRSLFFRLQRHVAVLATRQLFTLCAQHAQS